MQYATYSSPTTPTPTRRESRSWQSEAAAAWSGVPLFDWQADTLRRAMHYDRAANRLTRTEVALIVPRRNGKTQLLMARILGGCLGTGTARGEDILYTAHLGDTARAMFKAFLELLNNSPQLSTLVADVYHGKGDEAVVFTNGSRFTIRARTNSGGRGLESDTLILDEALELSDDHMSALRPLVAKSHAQGSGQIWLASSAGHGKSVVLAATRDRGRAAAAGATVEDDLAYFEWMAPRDADPAAPESWRLANPSLGTKVLSESFLRMQQRSMSVEGFGREHLGWWTSELADPFLPHGAWQVCAAPRPTPNRRARVAFGVEWQDYGHAVLVAAVETDSGSCWVETIDRWHNPAGLDPEQIAAAVIHHVKAVRPIVVAGDEFTCTTILDHMAAKGVKVSRLNQPNVRSASSVLLTAVTSGRITHPGDELTGQEMGNAGRAGTGDGGYRLSRKNATGRSTAAFATACAVWAILGPGPNRPSIVVAR
jgi:phage terminase large subunit-like protein